MGAVGRCEPRRGRVWHSAARWRSAALWWAVPDLSGVFDVSPDDDDPFYDDDADDNLDDDVDQLQHDIDEYLDHLDYLDHVTVADLDIDQLDNPILDDGTAAAAYRDDNDGSAARARHVDDRSPRCGAYDGADDTPAHHVARDAMTATALAEFTIGAAFIGGTIVGAAMTLSLLKIVRRQSR